MEGGGLLLLDQRQAPVCGVTVGAEAVANLIRRGKVDFAAADAFLLRISCKGKNSFRRFPQEMPDGVESPFGTRKVE